MHTLALLISCWSLSSNRQEELLPRPLYSGRGNTLPPETHFLSNAISIKLAVNARPVHVIGPQGHNGLPQRASARNKHKHTTTHSPSRGAKAGGAQRQPTVLPKTTKARHAIPEVQKQGATTGTQSDILKPIKNLNIAFY